MARFFLHAVGRDRPGIVAAIAGALANLGCNLEDSRMTLLRGQFAVMLVLEAPSISNGSLIESALDGVGSELDLVVSVRLLDDEDLPDQARLHALDEPAQFTVSVHGADHPGIVARIASDVAASGGNIVDLASRVVDAGGGYVLVLGVELAPGSDGDALSERLRTAADELGVRCSVAAADADVL